MDQTPAEADPVDRAMHLIKYHRRQGDTYVSNDRAVEILGLSRRRLNQLRDDGRLTAEISRRRVRFALDELERFTEDYLGWRPE